MSEEKTWPLSLGARKPCNNIPQHTTTVSNVDCRISARLSQRPAAAVRGRRIYVNVNATSLSPLVTKAIRLCWKHFAFVPRAASGRVSATFSSIRFFSLSVCLRSPATMPETSRLPTKAKHGGVRESFDPLFTATPAGQARRLRQSARRTDDLQKDHDLSLPWYGGP